MYNKLFTKILDSSIWLQSSDTRVVWVTLLAAMDEDGFVAIATPANLARRANVSDDACEKALMTLEAPEKETARDDDDGRRIERVPGGWIVIKAKEYQQMTTRQVVKNSSRERVKRWRERHRNAGGNAETLRNAGRNGVLRNQTQTQTQPQMVGNESESTKPTVVAEPPVARQEPSDDVPEQPDARTSSATTVDPTEAIYQMYPRKVGKRKAIEAIERSVQRLTSKQEQPTTPLDTRRDAERWLFVKVRDYANSLAGNRGSLTPHPTTWFNQSRYLDDPAEWQRQEEAHGFVKQSVTPGNIAACDAVIQRLNEGRSDAQIAGMAGELLRAPDSAGDVRRLPVGSSGTDEQRATGRLQPGSPAVQILPPAGRTASPGRMPDRRPTF